ncbi:MAG: hypothetical protein SFV15_12890 [Polyangiaceae bacterium]|nr:hypothetical protein [Polyangiaceae bacterium]
MRWQRPAKVWLSVALAGCEPENVATLQEPPSERSPNAKIQPAPLAPSKGSKADLGSAGGKAHAGGITDAAELKSVRDDQPVPAAPLTASEPETLQLQARFQWFDLPPSGTVRDVQRSTLDRLARRTALNMSLILTHGGRLRIRFDSAGFMFPDQSEVQARSDLLGHILVWPKGGTYRTLPLGSLRAVFLERRVDVTPLSSPAVAQRVGAGRAFEQPAEQSELKTSHGKVRLNGAQIAGFEASGAVLCRFLAELIGATPDNPICESGLVPIRADYQWERGGQLAFIVESLQRHVDPDTPPLQVPPSDARFTQGEWPHQDPLLADSDTLNALRASFGSEEAKGHGLNIFNNTKLLRYVLIDTTPVALLAPGTTLRVEVPAGRYQLQLRDFFGQDALLPRIVTAPTRVTAAPEVSPSADSEPKR